MPNLLPHTFAIQVRAAGGWRNITTYRFDPTKDGNRVGGRADAMRQARIGIRAWREYHEFQDEVLRIAECKETAAWRPEWVEVAS